MIVDLVVGVLVLVSALISFMRGFIREVLTIAGVVGGLMAAVFFGPPLVPTVREWFGVGENKDTTTNTDKLFGVIPMELVADVVTYGAIFISVVIVLYIVTHFISGAAKAVGLGPVDRTLGVVFGIARALVLLGLLYMPINVLVDPESKSKLFEGSATHGLIQEVSNAMRGFLPEYDVVKQEADDQFKNKLQETNLLSGGKKDEKVDVVPMNKEEQEGYKDEQRERLDELFNEPAFNE